MMTVPFGSPLQVMVMNRKRGIVVKFWLGGEYVRIGGYFKSEADAEKYASLWASRAFHEFNSATLYNLSKNNMIRIKDENKKRKS